MPYDTAICRPADLTAACPVERNPSEGTHHSWYLPVKTAVEWVAALVLLVLLAPVMGVLALLTKWTSPGPAFYMQTRLGKDGRPFSIYKIRTMTHNCELTTGPVWSAGNDRRVTPLGRFLRDTHLDELPQLWNVLQGDMSLIGPRPERPEIVARLETALPRYRERLQVRPGVTGLAQVHRPPDADLEDVRHKLAYDLHYVKEVSAAMDVRILVTTALNMVAQAFNFAGRLLVKSYGERVESAYAAAPPSADTRQTAGAA